MATLTRRPTHSDLKVVETPEAARDFIDRLGFRVEAEPLPVNPDDLGLSPQDRAAVESFHILADYDQKLIIGLWQLNDLSGARLRSLSHNFLGRGVDCLFLATNADFNPLVFVSPRRIAGGKTKVLKLVVDRMHPTRHDLDVLQAISDHHGDVPSILNALREAFNVDRVTKRFYQEYAKAFRGLQKALTESNRGVREFQGNTDEDKAYLHAFAQRLMGRLMFLYFVQKKGWLNGDKRFLTGWYALAHKGNYYRDVLEPLFFETLNTPEAARTDRARAFGDVPYLNGGLFERDHNFLLHLDNSVFDPDNEAGLLRFFNCYNFTVTEDTPLEVEVALDPEMLGKVFENLLEEEERGGTGTFYTPRVIVHGMCRDALAEYLQDAAQLGGGEVRQILADPEGTTVERTTAKRIEDALSKLRCLDPAVGSGAFLVGMLQEMVALRHACFRARGAEARRGSDVVAEWKREYIQECLYGVDIKQEAVEIAKLRLWLSLVVDLERDQIEPLPNLDYKLMAGNSLIEVLDGQPILNPRVAQATLGMSETDTALQELHALKDRFFAAKPQQRGEIIQTIRDTEAQVIEAHVREKLQAVEAEQARIVQRKTLDKGKLTATNERRLKTLYETGGHFARLGQDVREGKPLPFFLYELHFCEVFGDKGGFDVVIANPPYVATQGVNQLGYRDELEAQYGYRRDLYVHFVDRTLGLTDNACQPLLRPGGVMAFITSSTYFSQEFFHQFRSGAPEPDKRKPDAPWPFHRGILKRHLVKILDCPSVFDATVNTAVLVARNEPAPEGHEFTFVGASRLDQVIRRRMGFGGEALDLQVQEQLASEAPHPRPLSTSGEGERTASPPGPLSTSGEGEEVEWRGYTADGKRVLRLVQGGIAYYRLPLALYHDCIFHGIFEPSPPLLAFYGKYMRQWVETVGQEFEVGMGERTTLWDLVEDSAAAEQYRPHLGQYREALRPGDTTIIGAITEGGVGLQTGENERFLAYLEGTPEAYQLLSRNPGISADAAQPAADRVHGVGKIVSRRNVAEEAFCVPEYVRTGIPDHLAHWVPYPKGDPMGSRWCRLIPCYIDWSETAVKRLWERNGRPPNKSAFQNPHMYFRRGFSWTNTIMDLVKAYLLDGVIPDQKSLFLHSATEKMDDEIAVAVLNSSLVSHTMRLFMRTRQSFNVNHARLICLPLPSSSQATTITIAVREAIAVQRRRLACWTEAKLAGSRPDADPEHQRLTRELGKIEEKVDRLIADLYGLPVPQDPVEEILQAEAEG